MASSIESMSREINASSALASAKPPSPSQSKKLELPAPKKADMAPMKEAVKKLEKISDDQERVELYRKIRGYQKNDKLRKFLGDHQEPPKKTDSLEALKAQYADIKGALTESSKRMMVMSSFDNVLRFAELGAVGYLQMQEKIGMAQFLIEKKEEIFQPELEELIIELSDDWVPPAKIRVALKLMQAMMGYNNAAFSKPATPDAGPKPTEAGVPKAVPKGKR